MIFDENGLDRDVMRERILDYLQENKFKSVIDLGGALDPWAREFVTLYVDLWEPEDWLQRYPENLEDGLVQKTARIVGDLDHPNTWTDRIFPIVDEHGKFDFAICSHVIEHLANPLITLSMLSEIAEEGYVATPSKYTELKRGGHYLQCRGMLPHRWICTVRDGVLWLFPKLNFIEDVEFDWADHRGKPGELGFRWKDRVPFRIVTDKEIDDPDPMVAVEYYQKELKIGL